MTDTVELWELCVHGKVESHGGDADVQPCPGGNRVTLKNVKAQPGGWSDSEFFWHDGPLWVEVKNE